MPLVGVQAASELGLPSAQYYRGSLARPVAPRHGGPMLRRFAVCAFLCLLAVGSLSAGPATPAAARSQPTDLPRPFADLTRLADDVYAWRYQGYDTIFIVTD